MIEGSPLVSKSWFNQSVHFKKGAIAVLKAVPVTNILILYSESASQNESYDKLLRNLEDKQIHSEKIKIATESRLHDLQKKYESLIPEVIISVGGGQVLDSGKILRLLLENQSRTFSNLLDDGIAKHSITTIAIPTTPSTGSEANGTAVIKDDTGLKVPYVNQSLVPEVAILDSSFLSTISMENLYSFTGDIFGHAFESMVSKLSTPIVESLAWNVIGLLEESFSELNEKPGNPKSLTKLQCAGYLGGLIAGNAFVGVCHALAHSLELQKPTPHSETVLTLTQPCLSWHEKQTEDEVYTKLIKKYEALGLHRYIDDKLLINIDKAKWIQDALVDPSIKTSPIRMKEGNLTELVEWILQN